MSTLFEIVWLIWIIALIILYHKVFTVYYFNLGNGLLKELIGAGMIGIIMTAITFYLWWLTAIIIMIIGLINTGKTNKKVHIAIAIILAIMVSIIGIGIEENSNFSENQSTMSNTKKNLKTNSNIKKNIKTNLHDYAKDNDYDEYSYDYDDGNDGDNNYDDKQNEKNKNKSELVEVDNEYILPNSDKKKLTNKMVQSLSKEDIRLAINEIYARYGRKFNDKSLQKYFDDKKWYVGTINPEDFDESVFNKAEIYNIRLLSKYIPVYKF